MTQQSELRLRIAEAYEALTRLVSSSAEAERHRNHAVEIYRDILRRDDTNAQAMLGLAVVSQDRAERIELLKRGTELAPEEIYAMQLLASELLSTGEPQQALEAARVMEKAYASQTGRNKLHLASRTYELYLNAGATQEAAEFRQRVIDKLGTGNLKDLPSNVDPKTVLNALMASCDHLIVPMLGSQRCMQDLEIVARQLASKDKLARARELASVTAMA
ncbi:MAG: tetratricopeptide repeat protein, partial [Steroidobacteraceae bacterium]